MKLNRKTIETKNPPISLNWQNNLLVDWVSGGNTYDLKGKYTFSGRGYAYKFDTAIQSDNGAYAVVYEKLGTKGVILKQGIVIREINRSYYQADVYEYPITFIKLKNEQYAIVHCPNEYNQIEIEEIEMGKKITPTQNRESADCFHSRFRINDDGTFLINTGWVWHPYGIIELYDIKEGIKDISVFDKITYNFPTNSEIVSAEFIDNDHIVVSSSNEEPLDDEFEDETKLNPCQIGVYAISTSSFLKKVTVDYDLGRLVPINNDFVIDLYGYPKLIDLNTGKIVGGFKDIDSGKQNSSIIHYLGKIAPIAIDKKNNRIAIGNDNKIEIITVE